MLLLKEPLVIVSLPKFEKKIRLKHNHNVLKVALEGLKFFHLNPSHCNTVTHGD